MTKMVKKRQDTRLITVSGAGKGSPKVCPLTWKDFQKEE